MVSWRKELHAGCFRDHWFTKGFLQGHEVNGLLFCVLSPDLMGPYAGGLYSRSRRQDIVWIHLTPGGRDMKMGVEGQEVPSKATGMLPADVLAGP